MIGVDGTKSLLTGPRESVSALPDLTVSDSLVSLSPPGNLNTGPVSSTNTGTSLFNSSMIVIFVDESGFTEGIRGCSEPGAGIRSRPPGIPGT